MVQECEAIFGRLVSSGHPTVEIMSLADITASQENSQILALTQPGMDKRPRWICLLTWLSQCSRDEASGHSVTGRVAVGRRLV